LVQSFRRKARKQHSMPAAVDAEIPASFRSDTLAEMLPKQPAAQKAEKKIAANTAA
jgi:hypothetical protein